MDTERHVGLTTDGRSALPVRTQMVRSILLKLAAMGVPVPSDAGDQDLLGLGRDLFARFREQTRLLADHLAPADRRIQAYLDRLLKGLALPSLPRLPSATFILDRHGLARELSFPMNGVSYQNDCVSSYRLSNGALHNPTSDRRTTQGVFHVAEGGLPIPGDKIAVPLITFGHMLLAALEPPAGLRRLPLTSEWPTPVEAIASLLLRPLVCPAVPGVSPEKRMEVRFFAPGGLVSNLDFVESIFGNAFDPYLPENDAGLDVEHWTGHTGCVILAPHLVRLRKKDVGLPHVDSATAQQRAQGMCWSNPEDIYNEGKAFKITTRDMSGVIVTIIADNYFGYCKKEVKTQISYSANLFGLAEEEHAGGALAFPSWSQGEYYVPDGRSQGGGHRFEDTLAAVSDRADVHQSGWATDRSHPTVHYLPEDAEIDLRRQDINWLVAGEERHAKLLPDHVYIYPSGHKLRMEKHPAAPSWRLVRTAPEGTFCHKPCTVSGGGKSEISKSLVDAVIYGPLYVSDFDRDMLVVDEIFARDYNDRFVPGQGKGKPTSRPLLSPERSLGSVIKLLTPNDEDFTPNYNNWLRAIPDHIRAVVFIIKRFWNIGWERDDWRTHFAVDIVNGTSGHELKFNDRKLVASYLRIGVTPTGNWRTFKLRQDFMPADKVQMEDDITASVVVSAARLFGLPSHFDKHPSLKISENCEWRLFQRPDDAIHPGQDKQAETDMATQGLFVSNFQPLRSRDVKDLVEAASTFDSFTDPMKDHLIAAARRADGFDICSSKPRMVDGKPTKNPRYLQVRPDVARPRDRYVADMGARLSRRLPPDRAVIFPVDSVLSGRRNNPPEDGVRPLCVWNPIHFQELPELFMDYVCSLTGKSPSTTGAGSEGALTKGPFNALSPTADLNNTLVSMLLTGYGGFSTAAGFIGPRHRVDHDVSLLIPELWCRLSPDERDPVRMIAEGQLEKLADFDFEGRRVLASRLGYRITSRFVSTYLGRVFDSPTAVFTEAILKPETQDRAVFADGVDNIVDAMSRVATCYFDDGSIKDACPPLAALLHIMAHGHFDGKDLQHPDLRGLFTRESMLASAWYQDRLRTKQARDIDLWQRNVRSLFEFLALPGHREEADRLGIPQRLQDARAELERVKSAAYLGFLQGTIGADPITKGATPLPE